MKLKFEYNKDKDIWCLLNYGKKSVNSGLATKVYNKLTAIYGESPSNEDISNFIEKHISENNIDIEQFINEYEKDWSTIEDKFKKIAEEIFGVTLSKDVTVYLTTNNRCPYDLINNNFFVSMSNQSSIRKTTVMHELWHFYTWYSFGITEEEKMGKQRYNDIKEALTILLNIECKDLLPEGVEDKGYSQHAQLREKIAELWLEHKDLKKILEIVTS